MTFRIPLTIFLASLLLSVFLSYRLSWSPISWATLKLTALIMSGPFSALYMWPKEALEQSSLSLFICFIVILTMIVSNVYFKTSLSKFISVLGALFWVCAGFYCTVIFSV